MSLKKLISQGNVKAVFRQFKTASKYKINLMEIYLPKMRIWALKILSKTLGAKCDVEYLSELLKFENKE